MDCKLKLCSLTLILILKISEDACQEVVVAAGVLHLIARASNLVQTI